MGDRNNNGALPDMMRVLFAQQQQLWREHEQRVEAERRLNADPKVVGLKRMFEAAEKGNKQELQQLLQEHPADATDQRGWTALHYAADKGATEIVRYLVEQHRVSVNIENKAKNTPIVFAAFSNHLETTKLLVELGAEVNHVGEHGYTPLHWIIRDGREEIAKVLVRANADIEATTTEGLTIDSLASAFRVAGVAKVIRDEWKELMKCKVTTGIIDPASTLHTDFCNSNLCEPYLLGLVFSFL